MQVMTASKANELIQEMDNSEFIIIGEDEPIPKDHPVIVLKAPEAKTLIIY